jgi:hypothetical protein
MADVDQGVDQGELMVGVFAQLIGTLGPAASALGNAIGVGLTDGPAPGYYLIRLAHPVGEVVLCEGSEALADCTVRIDSTTQVSGREG